MRVGERWYRAVWWEDGAVQYIDQRLIPHEFAITAAPDTAAVAYAIVDMGVRGAPTIGVMAAYGLAQAVARGEDPLVAYGTLISTRPTAVNLKAGLDAVLPHCSSTSLALEAAQAHDDAEVAASERIGELGQHLITEGATVGTHCNAGWLAAQDWGTALSPVYKAAEAGKRVRVSADETRPRLQGARLTAWELVRAGIDHQIAADGATASLMRRGQIDIVITGADRIAANGDVANKIGTYPLALAAKANGVPFYVAAPVTTIDPDVRTGDDIPIEERSEEEVLTASGRAADGSLINVRMAPRESRAVNPAFDVTPANLVDGIITNHGVVNASLDGIREALGVEGESR